MDLFSSFSHNAGNHAWAQLPDILCLEEILDGGSIRLGTFNNLLGPAQAGCLLCLAFCQLISTDVPVSALQDAGSPPVTDGTMFRNSHPILLPPYMREIGEKIPL